MTNIKNNIIHGIPVMQNQQEFVIGVFTIDQILKFTKYTKRLIVGYDEDNEPIYNPQIQREVEGGRVDRIADFLIRDPEATFPTNIVLHIPMQVIEQQVKHKSTLEIHLADKVYDQVIREKNNSQTGDIFITIIDGQHRIRGIEEAIDQLTTQVTLAEKYLVQNQGRDNKKFEDEFAVRKERLKDLLNIQLVVSFFIDKSLEYQAMIFSTINRTQKRVSESLVYSLFGITSSDSPQKSALQIVLALNAHKKSPFYNRVKLYGGEYERNQSPPLSQATMIKTIVNLISESLRESENDRYKKRVDLLKRSDGSSRRLSFRIYYAKDQDTKISDLFYFYFNSVKTVFKSKDGSSYWDFDPETMRPENVLQTTVGYQALLDVLVDILEELPEKDRFISSNYETYLKRARNLNFTDIQRYPFTSKTRYILYLDLSLAIWPAVTKGDDRSKKLQELLRN